jgi:hypothetical protein
MPHGLLPRARPVADVVLPPWMFGVHKRKLANSPATLYPSYNRLARPWILFLDDAPSFIFCDSNVDYLFFSPALE